MWIFAALLLVWCVGILGRGYWTPDEPREADIAWRMSRQADKAVPQLAGEAFCEKPPLTYWLAGASMKAFGTDASAARLPNLLFALMTALGAGLLARRSAGPLAGIVAAAAISTFLLSYQVAIWLATDAPLLATVSVALLGAYIGFYANGTRERLCGYLAMHAALGLGFLCKSAAAWMVPMLALVTLAIWERRWRELLRWELYLGLPLQAAAILIWVWFVYIGPDGAAHLKIFFWNNLVGRFARVDAPSGLQYTSAHRNSPGKYLIELPLYLWPWTLLIIAAARRAWRQRHSSYDELRAVRFAFAASLPPLAVLSVAATARNIYLAPALPGVALLLGWWAREVAMDHDHWDLRALRGTAILLLLAVIVFAGALAIMGLDAWDTLNVRTEYVAISTLGLAATAILAARAGAAARRGDVLRAQFGLFLSYCVLLVGPASQAYQRVNHWQDLAAIGRAVERDAAGRPLILFAPDETTRAMIDMYARTSVGLVEGPVSDSAIELLRGDVARAPESLVVAQLPGREPSRAVQALASRLGVERFELSRRPDGNAEPDWASEAHLRTVKRYALPNGRRYLLLELYRQPL